MPVTVSIDSTRIMTVTQSGAHTFNVGIVRRGDIILASNVVYGATTVGAELARLEALIQNNSASFADILIFG